MTLGANEDSQALESELQLAGRGEGLRVLCLLLLPAFLLLLLPAFGQVENATGVVTGRVTLWDFDFKVGRPGPRAPLPGARVFLRKQGTVLETRSDSAGRFQFDAVPAGLYEASCLVPEPFLRSGPEHQEVKVTAGKHTFVELTAESQGSISGRILNRSGEPLPRIPLCLGLAQPVYPDAPRTLRTISDENGSFTFRPVPPGRYHLGLRLDHGDASSLPYPRIYFPGVTSPSQATPIQLGEGEELRDIELVLPEQLTERVVGGRVVLPSGAPAAYARVIIEITDYPYTIKAGETTTDGLGTFSLPAFNGLHYRVRAVGAVGKSTGEGVAQTVPETGSQTNLVLALHPLRRPVNLLVNPYADLGADGCKSQKETLIDRSLGDPCFAVRNQGYFLQDVGLPLGSSGKYALLFGRLATERINEDGSVTGLPYLYGYMMSGRYGGGRIFSYLQGESMAFRGDKVGEWQPAYGVFRVPPETRFIRFFLNQAERKGDPQNGSLARFDDLALCLFDSQEEAWAFVDELSRSNWRVRDQVDASTPWDSSTPAEARLTCSACATHRAPTSRIRGEVELKCKIGPDGKATDCEVQRSMGSDLDQTAIEVVRTRWVFTPATEHGTPVAGSAVVQVTLVDCVQ